MIPRSVSIGETLVLTQPSMVKSLSPMSRTGLSGHSTRSLPPSKPAAPFCGSVGTAVGMPRVTPFL
jgi:hypothetical protein